MIDTHLIEKSSALWSFLRLANLRYRVGVLLVAPCILMASLSQGHAAPLNSQTIKVIVEHALTSFPQWFFGEVKREDAFSGKKILSYECGLAELTSSTSMTPTLLSSLVKRQIVVPTSLVVEPDQRASVLSMWAHIADGPVYNQAISFTQERGHFAHVSEHALQWLEKISLSAHDPIFKTTFRALYHSSFKRSVTLFVSAYLHLAKNDLFKSEAQRYLNASISNPKFYGPRYLRSRFSSVLPEFKDLDWCTSASREMGFWLRRELDGSRARLWNVTVRIMDELDPGLLSHLSKNLEKTSGQRTRTAQSDVPSPSEAMPKSNIDLKKLYASWLQKPYEFMFQGEGTQGEVEVGSLKLGTFLAGTRGILYYGGLNRILSRMFNHAQEGFEGNAIWSKVTGIPLVKPRSPVEGQRLPFLYVNPKIVAWGIQNLMLDPKEMITDRYSAQNIYDLIFKRYFRLLAESYHFLRQKRALVSEVQKYQEHIRAKGDALKYLASQYGHILSQYHIPDDYGTFFQPYHAVGFWLRREIDQSAPVLWRGLQTILERFDQEWFKKSFAPRE